MDIGVSNWRDVALDLAGDGDRAAGAGRVKGAAAVKAQLAASKAYVPTTGAARVLWAIFTLGINEAVRSVKIARKTEALEGIASGLGAMHKLLMTMADTAHEYDFQRKPLKRTEDLYGEREGEKWRELVPNSAAGYFDEAELGLPPGCRIVPGGEEFEGLCCYSFRIGPKKSGCDVLLGADKSGLVKMVLTEDGRRERKTVSLGTAAMALARLEDCAIEDTDVFEPELYDRMLDHYDHALATYKTVSNNNIVNVPMRLEFKKRQLHICRKILASRCGMSRERLDYLDRGMGVAMAKAAVRGELDGRGRCEAFFDRITSTRHINDEECMKLYDRLDQVRDGELPVTFSESPADEDRTGRPSVAQQPVHDLAADLLYDGDLAAYDRDLGKSGHLDGKRMCAVVVRHRETLARLAGERLAAPDRTPASLESLEPEMRASVTRLVDAFIDATRKGRRRSGAEPVEVTAADVGRKIDSLVSDFRKNEERDPLARTLEVDDLAQDRRFQLGIESHEVGSADYRAEMTHAEPGEDYFAAEEKMEQTAKLEEQTAYRRVGVVNFFSQLELEVEHGLVDAMKGVQDEISKMVDETFPEPGRPDYDVKRDGLDKIIADHSNDADMILLRKVMKDYFKSMNPVDQRSMLASQTRNTVNGASKGRMLGELLKGAGPVLQKMLQGLDPATFKDNPDFARAIDDMRSNLAPIPRRTVSAYLLDIVEKYNADPSHADKIAKIDVKQSCGAASVAQTFLCEISFESDPDHPRECVVKLLRPDAKLRALREADLFRRHAAVIRGMGPTFESRLAGIMDELDLRNEAANVDKGVRTYDSPENRTFANVRSMRLYAGIPPTSNAMVLVKAPGETLDKSIKAVGNAADAIRARVRGGGDPLVAAEQLTELYDDVKANHNALYNLTYTWIKEGLFARRQGFYHGDLHSGNIMVPKLGARRRAGRVGGADIDVITMIDFGNARTLTPDEQTCVIKVVAGAAGGAENIGLFVDGFEKLLSPDERVKFDRDRDEIVTMLTDVLSEGRCSDASKRMKVAFKLLQQRFDIEIPGVINDFLCSQDRLAVAMESTLRGMTWVESRRLDVLTAAARRERLAVEETRRLDELLALAADKRPADYARWLFAARKAVAEAYLDRKAEADGMTKDDFERIEKLRNAVHAAGEDRPKSIMSCMVDVISQHIVTALRRVGLKESRKLETRFRAEGLIGDAARQNGGKEYRFDGIPD